MRKTEAERYWVKVEKTDECWIWTATVTSWGYGQFWLNGKHVKAHRYSFELAHGPIAEGLDIDHLCHNRACVRPEHLRAATRKQNMENRKGADSDNYSGVRGVHWHKAARKWQAHVRHNGHLHYVGTFSSKEDAELAVVAKRNELFTHNDHDRKAA